MLFGLLGIWIGGLAILLSFFFYTRAMFADLRGRRTEEAGAKRKDGEAKARHLHAQHPGTRGAGDPNTQVERFCRLGRRAFYVAMGGALVAAATLWVMLLGRHYEVAYVWQVTDQALPLKFRIAAFWADQEGTFLLWLIYGFILSSVLLRRIGKNEPYVMPFIGAVQLFLFIMLVTMTPFKVVPQRPEGMHLAAWPAFLEMLGLGKLDNIPHDGNGLNILLQNLWMTIHPPIMFMGFSSTLIPCALALGALVKRDWDGWVRSAMPWALYAFMFLGFGKFLGGYWAYETLGWGGYWAWDPVENASFVPWLLSAALVHGLQAQQARGSWKQVNLLLAITTFLSFFYGTFLTRSGALNEFSVHSFVSPGGLPLVLLLGFLLFFCAAFWGLWLWRFARIHSEPTYDRFDERPFGFFLGIVLFIGSALIVLIGMSWPIISRAFTHKAASINYQFYNRALLPVGFFIALLMAITPLLAWRRRQEGAWKPKPLLLFALGMAAILLAATPVALWAAWRGHNDPALYAFVGAVSLALVTNVAMLINAARGGILQTGGWLMHVGFCLALLGVISTSRYSIDSRMIVAKGETKRLYGYDLTYTGLQEQPNGRNVLGVRVENGDQKWEARPHSFIKNGQRFNTPYIIKFWNKDLYIAPEGRIDGSSEAELKKGQQGTVSDNQSVTFERFMTSGGRPDAEGQIDIGVLLSVNTLGVKSTVQPHLIVRPNGELIGDPVDLPGGAYQVKVTSVRPNLQNPEESTVMLQTIPKVPIDVAGFTVSTKPNINVLWLGGYMMFVGGILAWRRRAAIAAKARDKQQEPGATSESSEPARARRQPGLRPEPATLRMASPTGSKE
jgi:cytochrome c-type biogenesis protein CcmF